MDLHFVAPEGHRSPLYLLTSVERMLRFSTRPDKTVNAMAFFAERCPGITKMKIFKLMYFADKEHLLRYGRPITGDRYVAMKWGPTPSASYDMTKGSAPSRQMSLFHSKLTVAGNSVKGLHSPDMKVFSRSDEQVLNEIADKYGKMTAAKLSNLSHKEAAWRQTPENKIIDFELMFQGRADAAITLELLRQDNAQQVNALETT